MTDSAPHQANTPLESRFKTVAVITALLFAYILITDTIFVTMENEQVVILRYGKFVRTVTDAGLNFKLPFVEQREVYDDRLLDYDAEPAEVVTKDKRNLLVDNFAKWRITDPEKFYKRLRTIESAQGRIDDIVYSELRQEFGNHNLEEIVSETRASIMNTVTARSNEKAQQNELGIAIVDIRIKRADLPEENKKAVFARMRAERDRIANQFRSEGNEEAQKLRATTDKEKAIILAEAYRKEQQIRGEGDATSMKIYADAYSRDPEFYSFIRSLTAYQNSLGEDSTIVLTPGSDFLRHFDAR